MSKEWPLDDVKNQRWSSLLEYIDELVDEIDVESKSLLLCSVAFFESTVDVINRLVHAGADPSFRYIGKPNIRFASGLEPGTSPIGQTILGAAWGRQNTISVLECLLFCGADPDGITYSGYTPIQLAIVFGQREHAKVLLDNGASPLKSSADFDAPNAFDLSKDIPWANEMLKQYASEKRGE